jgi:hypothetical protein
MTQKWKTPQGECAPYCKDCLFYLPEEICPAVAHSQCKFTPGPDGFDYKLLQWCLTNIPGKNGPACMKNCDDWKYAPDYGK